MITAKATLTLSLAASGFTDALLIKGSHRIAIEVQIPAGASRGTLYLVPMATTSATGQRHTTHLTAKAADGAVTDHYEWSACAGECCKFEWVATVGQAVSATIIVYGED